MRIVFPTISHIVRKLPSCFDLASFPRHRRPHIQPIPCHSLLCCRGPICSSQTSELSRSWFVLHFPLFSSPFHIASIHSKICRLVFPRNFLPFSYFWRL